MQSWPSEATRLAFGVPLPQEAEGMRVIEATREDLHHINCPLVVFVTPELLTGPHTARCHFFLSSLYLLASFPHLLVIFIAACRGSLGTMLTEAMVALRRFLWHLLIALYDLGCAPHD